MSFMSAALGVGCAYCHTGDWASDEKSAKLATRRMIAMTRAINNEYFSSNPAVTCYTCHRGKHNTEPLLPAELAALGASGSDTTARKTPPLPTPDEVIARYTAAVGGEAAVEKLKTRVLRGVETTSDGMSPPQQSQIEIIQAAPDRLLIARNSPRGKGLEAFDGSKAWAKDTHGQREMTAKETRELKREADFFKYLKIRESYPQMRVLARERVLGREAYAVGATSRDDTRERLYFDVDSGLLIRRYVAFKTAFGSIPDVTDFDDYREIGGVKLPFKVTWSRPPFFSVRSFTEMKVNLSVDASLFSSPTK
jgi:hypothetical protein